jgi:uncharacterized RDD family membrane protein YckC
MTNLSTQLLNPSDETLVIETPERVALHFALASIGNRFLACAFDHALQTLAIVIIIYGSLWLTSIAGLEALVAGASKWVLALIIIAAFVVWSSYFIVFEWLWSGQTPGKRWLKLRVIREDGRPITLWESAIRNLLRIFDMMPLPFYSVGLISVFASTRDQRIGDLFAGSVVVRERAAEAPSFDEVFASPVSDTAMRRTFKPVQFAADISVLTESEIEVVEAFLRRRFDMPDRARQWTAWRVATPILYKIKPSYDPSSFAYEGFLEELLHRYREKYRFIH